MPGRLAGVLDLEYRLMQIVVEALAGGVDAADAVALERREQLALGRGTNLDSAPRIHFLNRWSSVTAMANTS